MKEWRVLVILEYEWRVFCFYRKLINELVKKGVKLSSPVLCILNKGVDKHGLLITVWKEIFERQTGKVIKFYKCDNY